MDEDARQVALPYRHTQIGVLTVVGSIAGFLTQLFRAVRDVRRHRRRAWVSVPRAALMVCAMALFSSLRVEVDENAVVAGFTGGALLRRVPLSEIETAKVVTVPWYHGWGLRKVRDGWMYNVAGRRAVELGLHDARIFTIGSDEPDALLAAIERARALRTPAAA
jgi:hypothetical protein